MEDYIDEKLFIEFILGYKKKNNILWYIPEKYYRYHYYDVAYYSIYKGGYLFIECLYEEPIKEYILFITHKNSLGDILFNKWFTKNDIPDIYNKLLITLDLKID